MGMINIFKEGDKFINELEVTTELMDTFAKISGDRNPLHTNEEHAIAYGFSGKVAYGNILGLMVSALVGEKLPSKEVMLLSQRVNYNNPIYIGDKIKLVGEVRSVSESVSTVELKLFFTNINNDTVASGRCQFKCI